MSSIYLLPTLAVFFLLSVSLASTCRTVWKDLETLETIPHSSVVIVPSGLPPVLCKPCRCRHIYRSLDHVGKLKVSDCCHLLGHEWMLNFIARYSCNHWYYLTCYLLFC
jgi:hypothetical protein